MTIEKQPLEDVAPIQKCDFPLSFSLYYNIQTKNGSSNLIPNSSNFTCHSGQKSSGAALQLLVPKNRLASNVQQFSFFSGGGEYLMWWLILNPDVRRIGWFLGLRCVELQPLEFVVG